jgi:hypothetical protein
MEARIIDPNTKMSPKRKQELQIEMHRIRQLARHTRS